ncbi:TPA: hypothetical protein N0F65_010839 [Lagenidium giganteum]|uniref:Uncharacterized protein n=1 Tax=Lagenidium giganteum TaxID=4803 RepID=A0AAV2Z6C0_9STRA|nr:TPA: hypothetical protein N0F65_010839 [Lagenidium giganteum]
MIVLVGGVLLLIKRLLRILDVHTDIAVTRTLMLPYSACSLWPVTALAVAWQSTLVVAAPRSMDAALTQMLESKCDSKRSHEAGLVIPMRTRELHSLIRLMNVAIMTDPITFARLHWLGTELFVYEYKQEGDPRTNGRRVICLLPFSTNGLAESIGNVATWKNLRLIGKSNTADVDWNTLVQCG